MVLLHGQAKRVTKVRFHHEIMTDSVAASVLFSRHMSTKSTTKHHADMADVPGSSRSR